MNAVPSVPHFITISKMTKVELQQFFILSTFVLSCAVAHVHHSPVETTKSHNETSKVSMPIDSTTLKTTPSIPDEDPFTMVANLTKSNNSSSSEEPMNILATVKTAKPEDGKAPSVSLVPPSSPGAPVSLVAHVPPQKPVQINADVPPETHVKFQADVAPDVPVVAFVVGHGTARFYSPWKKASSTTRNMFNVNLK